MLKKLNISFLILSLLLMITTYSSQNNISENINIDFFYISTCPHCHKVLESGLFNDLEKKGYHIHLNEVSNNQTLAENMEKLQNYYNTITNGSIEIGGVPFIIIYKNNILNGTAIQGDEEIINYLKKLNSSNKNNISIKIEEKTTKKQIKKEDYIGKLFLAITLGGADSINPCIMAILVLLLSIISKYDPKKAIKYGLLFTFVVFISYYIIGILLFFGLNIILNNISYTIGKYVLLTVILIILLIGIINIKESINPKGLLKIPDKQLEKVKKLIEEGTIIAILTMAVMITIIEFPCSGIMYLGFAAAFISTKSSLIEYLIYLIIYNIIFVMPLLLIIFGYKKTNDIKRFKEIRIKYRRILRLIMGLVMIILAIWLLFHYHLI